MTDSTFDELLKHRNRKVYGPIEDVELPDNRQLIGIERPDERTYREVMAMQENMKPVKPTMGGSLDRLDVVIARYETQLNTLYNLLAPVLGPSQPTASNPDTREEYNQLGSMIGKLEDLNNSLAELTGRIDL